VKTMAEVLYLHRDQTDDYAHKCSCGWSSLVEESQEHQESMLTAAGFGLLADAWDEGRESFALSLLRPLRDDLTRESIPNPYRKETGR